MKEEYVGIKFKVEFLEKLELASSKKLLELIQWCKVFDEFNLAPPYNGGSAGNLSFRAEVGKNEMVITGTKIGLKNNLTFDKFVTIKNADVKQNLVQVVGLIEPSSESMLHWEIYKAQPEINAIFHGHSDVFLDASQKLKWTETENDVPYGSANLVEEVLRVLKNNDIIIIKNHGFLILGKSMDETGVLTMQKRKEALLVIRRSEPTRAK